MWTRDIKKAINTAKVAARGHRVDQRHAARAHRGALGRLQAVGRSGRELGENGVEDYLEAKHIWINLTED